MTLRSVRSDGADRRLLWPQQSSAAAGVPAGLTEQLQLRIAVEAGAPPRVLKELAAALGADTTASAPTSDGGRALVVQQLYEGAALLSGSTVAREGWQCHLLATHAGGLRELGSALAAAGASIGDTAAQAARRAATLQRLGCGSSLRSEAATAAVTERLQEVHDKGAGAGLERVAETGERTMARVAEALEKEPGILAAATLQMATDDIAARQASLERATMPADAMD